MTDEPTHTTSGRFFTPDVRIKKREMTTLGNKAKKNQGKSGENEWIQEYELIYLSHKYENWNLEETEHR